jgi:hypothetical protein
MIYANAIGKIRNPNTRLPGLSYPIPARDIGKATAKQLPLHDTSTQVAGRSKFETNSNIKCPNAKKNHIRDAG